MPTPRGSTVILHLQFPSPRGSTVILHVQFCPLALPASLWFRRGDPTTAPRPPRARLHRIRFPRPYPRLLRCSMASPVRNPASSLSCSAAVAWMIPVPRTISSSSAPGRLRTGPGRGAAGTIVAAVPPPPIASSSPYNIVPPGRLATWLGGRGCLEPAFTAVAAVALRHTSYIRFPVLKSVGSGENKITTWIKIIEGNIESFEPIVVR